MGIINICGRECVFPSVPHSILKNINDGFGATPRTHLLAWKTAESTHQICISYMLYSMHELGGLETAPYFVEDSRDRTIVLLEHPNRTLLDYILSWLSFCVGLHYVHKHPYAEALAEELKAGDDKIKEIDFWLSYHQHPTYLKWKATQYGGSPTKIAPDSISDIATRQQ